MQKINPALTAPGQARPEWEILRDLLAAVSHAWKKPTPDFPSLGKLFAAFAEETPALKGWTWESIGGGGRDL